MDEKLKLTGFTYTPRKDANYNGTIKKYAFYISINGKDWGKPVKQGEFGNILNNPVKQFIQFEKAVETQYIKLIALSEIRDNPWASAGEIGVITQKNEK